MEQPQKAIESQGEEDANMVNQKAQDLILNVPFYFSTISIVINSFTLFSQWCVPNSCFLIAAILLCK